MAEKNVASSCDLCAYFNQDDETGFAVCNMSLDEDEMINFLKGRFNSCPYFKLYDEYSIVRKQN